jgi:hypothetical protein
MEPRKQTFVRTIGTAFVSLVGALAALALYYEVRPLPTFPSPLGQRTLHVSINHDPGTPRHLCLIIDVVDAQGKSLLREVTRASKTMRWDFHWDDDATLILDSGDVGTFKWTEAVGKWSRSVKIPDGTWRHDDDTPRP